MQRGERWSGAESLTVPLADGSLLLISVPSRVVVSSSDRVFRREAQRKEKTKAGGEGDQRKGGIVQVQSGTRWSITCCRCWSHPDWPWQRVPSCVVSLSVLQTSEAVASFAMLRWSGVCRNPAAELGSHGLCFAKLELHHLSTAGAGSSKSCHSSRAGPFSCLRNSDTELRFVGGDVSPALQICWH